MIEGGATREVKVEPQEAKSITKESSLRFCECGNLLEKTVTQEDVGKLMFKCTACPNTYPTTDNDTLLASGVTGSVIELKKYWNFLRNAARDETNPRVLKPCPNCKNKIRTFLRLGENEQVVYVCGQCNNVSKA